MNGWVALRYLLLNATGFSVLFILCDRKYAVKKTLAILGVGFVVITAVNVLLQYAVGLELWGQLFPFTTNITGLVLMFFLSRNRGLPLLFNLLTAIQVGGIISLPGIALTYLGGAVWMDILIRLVLTVPLLFWLYRAFRPAYLSALPLLGTGSWGLLCLMPLSFYIIFYLLLMNGEATLNPLYIAVIALALVMMIAAYGLIFFLFCKYSQEASLKNDRDILNMQVRALHNQADTMRRTEEQIRLYRHDMRHYTANIAALLREGDMEAALRFVDQFHDKFKEPSVPHYVSNPAISAILSSYLERAQEMGARISFKGDLPKKLPCDEIALATVFSNAIENACHALEKLPEGDSRRLEIVCVNGPQLVIEIANTFDGHVEFDENHYPIAHENDHGLGTKSILAFAKDNGAFLDYKVDKSMFRLRILINKLD
jgi:signal transduction histidine kinase